MSTTSQVLRFKVLLLPENVFKRFSMGVDECTFDKLKQVISSNAANAIITSIKYEDTEGDWIMLSSQTELDEAVRMNLFKKDENEVIRLQVQLSAPVVAPKPSVSPVVLPTSQQMLYPNPNPNPQPQRLPSPPAAQPQPSTVVVVPRRNILDAVSDAIGEVFSIFTGPTTTTTAGQCKPVQNQQPQPQQNQAAGRSSVHAGVMCDGCRASPIVGTRWQCCVCPASFDLCTECFNNKRTVLHPANHYFREVSAPSAAARVSSVPQPQPQPQPQPIPPQQLQPVVQPQFQPVVAQQQQPNLQLVQQQQPLPTYQQELDILATMGFTNRELCLDLLRKHGGSIPVVVELYLQQAPQQRTQ